jgi:hypothetical protein
MRGPVKGGARWFKGWLLGDGCARTAGQRPSEKSAFDTDMQSSRKRASNDDLRATRGAAWTRTHSKGQPISSARLV